MTIEIEAQHWYEGKSFSSDWITKKLPIWRKFLRRYSGRPLQILELGAFEGRSAIAFLNLLPDSRITCIDIFPKDLETVFDSNLEEYGGRVTKIKAGVIGALEVLIANKRKFQIIYVDAGKKRDHVYVMSLLAWQLLRPNGLIIWDDYSWGLDRPAEDRPRDGIDKFLRERSEDLEILHAKNQVFARRIAPMS